MNISKVIKFKQGQPESHGNHDDHESSTDETGPGTEEFLSYEAIWQMTGGTSADTDSSLLVKMQEQYKAVLRQANEIVVKARTDADGIEQEAYKKGFEQGRKAGEAEGRQRFDVIIDEFNDLFQTLQGKALRVDQVYEQNILDLVKVMVDRLVGHEISISPDVIRACLEKALEHVVRNARLRIHFNPVDYRNLTEFGLNMPGLPEGDSRVVLIEDAGISAGGCLLSTDYGDVDATLENRKALLYELVDQAFKEALNDSAKQQDKENKQDP